MVEKITATSGTGGGLASGSVQGVVVTDTTSMTNPARTPPMGGASSPGILRVRLDADGTEGKPIEFVIPRALSLRVARMHAIEQIGKGLKGPAVTDALKAMGFK